MLNKYSNKYDKISHCYNELMLHGYYNYEALTDRLDEILQTHNVVDVLELGIGTGLVASRLIKKGPYNLTGIDFSAEMMELCDLDVHENVDMFHMDVVNMDLKKKFEAAYCVGGAWYFIDNKNEKDSANRFQLCSHIPDLANQLQSFQSVVDHLTPEGVLLLSIQGPHHDFEETLPSGTLYRQKINLQSDSCFEKLYIFEKDGAVIAKQECLYRLTDIDDANTLFSKVGLKILSFEETNQYVVLGRI